MKKIREQTLPLFDRDLSWLSFNERVLMEAERDTVPLMERIRFMAIYSSNLDEFYRVRVPALMALRDISKDHEAVRISMTLEAINKTVLTQQNLFGEIVRSKILPALRENNYHLIYNHEIPDMIQGAVREHFMNVVAGYLQITNLSEVKSFFPENHKLYIVVTAKDPDGKEGTYVVNVPSDLTSRFFTVRQNDANYLVFLEDVIRFCLPVLFPGHTIQSSHNVKVSRDSDLNLEDEFTGNLARKIEKKIGQRDTGFASRFLYEPGIAVPVIKLLKKKMALKNASFILGGRYHNLKDLASLPVKDPALQYSSWPQAKYDVAADTSLFDEISRRDILLHPPYHSYDTVLRFFNEAAVDPTVKAICVTLYRVASDSRIANALISAAKNGKKVVVFVELKARFDEANNIRWSKKLKAAGVRIIESIPGLKVHAKLALVKRKVSQRSCLVGLIATGNFNEGTARFYTDHLLMTSRMPVLKEVEQLFDFLKKRKTPSRPDQLTFKKLLVGQFNLQERFIELIDREIANAQLGKRAGIVIKFNNLEDTVLISKLYDASRAGVPVSLIVRGICCLVPGVSQWSENITVKRIIDRYLEHGRVFIFTNDGEPQVFLGSADWMNRNIYRRIEVCFPLEEPAHIAEMQEMINIQVNDNCQAVSIDSSCKNVKVQNGQQRQIRSQQALSEFVGINERMSE